MIRALIVENEPSNYDYLKAMLDKHFEEIELLAIIDNIPEAIEKVRELNPDLIFLDIELPPYTGFNLLEETRGLKYHTIFTTSFNQYAVKAFKFSAVHYLEKPFGLSELKEALELYNQRVGERTENEAVDTLLHNIQEKEVVNQIVGIPVMGGHEFIRISNILSCQAQNNYTDLRMMDGKKVTVTKTLRWVENLLNEHLFYRVHKSYIINLNQIKKYMRGDGGTVVMSDGYEVDVARNKKEPFIQKMKDLGMM